MPLIYLGTGWFIGIALASAFHLPIEYLLPAFLFPLAGFFLWRHDRRARLSWISVGFALAGALWFTLRLLHFDQNSLSTYNGIGVVTIEGVIVGPPDVRDTYLNLRVEADRLTTPDRTSRPIEGAVLVRPSRPAEFHYGDRVRVTGALSAPPAHQALSDWSPERFQSWAEQIGPHTAQLIEAVLISRLHPQQAYRICLGILSLAKRYSATRLAHRPTPAKGRGHGQAACCYALPTEIRSYKGVRHILDAQLDRLTPTEPLPDLAPPDHANLRGSIYYH